MKVLVPVKRVIDYNVHIRVRSDQSGVETDHVKMSMNPFDEIAVEEAVCLKEKSIASEVIAVTIGTAAAQETLRQAMAMGCDRAVHVVYDQKNDCEPLQVARLLKEVVGREDVQLVIMGKQAIDDDCNQCGQMLAALLQWAQATFVSQLEVQDQAILATREIDGGLETLQCPLPAVVTTDLRLNTPRYASLPHIMQAKRKPIASVSCEELGVAIEQHWERLAVREPSSRAAGMMVKDVDELIDQLKNKAKVL